MRLVSIATITMLLAVGANAAMIHVDTDSAVYSSAPGTIATVTVTLTTMAETMEGISAFAVQVGWDPSVVKVAGSNPPATFGNSAQSQMIPGLLGTLTPLCATTGPTAGKVCTVITQANVGDPVELAPGIVVIGTLLLEVVPGAVHGSPLGLSISAYINNSDVLMDPAADPNLTVTSGFASAKLNPEPATAALLAFGLVGLGLAGRRRRLS